MRRYITAYIATLLVVVAMDACWLTLMGKSLYRDRLGDILLPRPVIWAAIAFYLLYALGIVALVETRGLKGGAWITAPLFGALLGLVAYGTYDLTNQATMRLWSGTITVVDMGWGAVLTATAATAGTWVARHLG